MSEDEGGRRRPGGRDGADGSDDDSRPVTAAGRRRRGGESDASGATGAGKDTATPTRDGRPGTEGSPIARLRRFLREVVAELRKVHWPTRRQIVVYTFVVLVFVAFMVSYVAVLDIVFQRLTFTLFG